MTEHVCVPKCDLMMLTGIIILPFVSSLMWLK